jgi:phosphate transport system substrate-binding protein
VKVKFFIILFLTSFCIQCTTTPYDKSSEESPKQGTIHISVDESFKPAIQEQIKVYQSTYPNAKIIAHYKSEADCFRDLQKDSTRLIIVSRGLNENEREYYKSMLSFYPQYALLAYDAVAAIVNQKNVDSIYSISTIKKMLKGEENYTVVLDGSNSTSTVKYLQDSLLKKQSFGKNVVAVNGADSVIEVIKKNTNAIGFVGNSWVSNGYDTKQLENLKTIKLALVECSKLNEKGYYAKASQATLQYGQYPFSRPVFFIVKENWLGLGTGFTNFLGLEQGQLIFKSSSMVPAKLNFNKRITKL